MDRLVPAQARADEEPRLPPAPGAASRATTYLLLAALVVAGGWLRFHDRIAALYAPPPSADAVSDPALAALVSLPAIPTADTAAALATLNLPAPDQAAVAAALRDGRLKLIHMPLFATGAAGGVVQVATAGYARTLPVTATPVVVTLPIDRAGIVSITPANAAAVTLGAITTLGPVPLPPIQPGQRLDVAVIAQ